MSDAWKVFHTVISTASSTKRKKSANGGSFHGRCDSTEICGHVKQAGMAAVSATAAARNGRFMVVVRKGIDLYHY